MHNFSIGMGGGHDNHITILILKLTKGKKILFKLKSKKLNLRKKILRIEKYF